MKHDLRGKEGQGKTMLASASLVSISKRREAATGGTCIDCEVSKREDCFYLVFEFVLKQPTLS
jgi:hypothetical protein